MRLDFADTQEGQQAKARLQEARLFGGPVVLEGDAVSVRLPDALENIMRDFFPPDPGAKSTVTFRNAVEGRRVGVLLVVAGKEEHPSLAAFKRAVRGSLTGVPADMEVVAYGEERKVLVVEARGLPIRLTLNDMFRGDDIQVSRKYFGTPIHVALAAERMVDKLVSEGRAALVTEQGHVLLAGVLGSSSGEYHSWSPEFELIYDLGHHMGVDFLVEEHIPYESIQEAALLLALYEHGSLNISSHNATVTVPSLADGQEFHKVITSDQPPIRITVRLEAEQKTLFGRKVNVPAMQLEYEGPVISDDSLAALVDEDSAFPMQLRVSSPKRAEVMLRFADER